MNAAPSNDSPYRRAGGMTVPAEESGREVGLRQDGSLGPVGGAYGFPDEQLDNSFDLLRYWGLFLKYRWIFLAGATIAICFGYGKTVLTTPIYRASATIEIDREPPKVIELDNQQIGEATDAAQFYHTEYQLLKSRSLAKRVVTDLDLANRPKLLGEASLSPWTKFRQIFFGGHAPAGADYSVRTNGAIGAVMGGLSVQPIPSSALVRLSFDSPSREGAKAIVNAVGAAFIQTNLEHRYNATAYARRFLQDQIAQLKLKLGQSERAVLAYAQKQEIVNLDDKRPLAAADLLTINSELAKVRARRIRNEELWHQAKTEDGLGLPQILADKTVEQLRASRAALEATYYDKLSAFKPDFPDMKRLRAQINEINHEIGSAVSVIKKSIRASYVASQQQETMLLDELKKNKDNVLDAESRDIQYKILQREVDTNRSLYNALLQRYKDVGVAGGVGVNNISVIDPAQLPGAPFSPSLKKNLGIALVLGLLASALIAYILEILDDTFKTPEQIEESLQIPVLGIIPLIGKEITIEEALEDPHSAFSEAYRSVRTALQFSTDVGAPKSLLVTSSRPSEGKSATSLALARNFAQMGLKVLLVDADLRNPSLHKALKCENTVGLSNYLAGGSLPPNTFNRTAIERLAFLASGPLPPNPAELLAGPKLPSLLTAAHQRFDLVILDGPPVLGLADAPLLGSVAAGTLMVVGACDARRGVVKNSLKRLHFARARMVGALLSKFDERKIGFAYGYNYGYGYGYGSNDYYSYGTDTPKLADKPSE